jgi:hypothetical protein
VRWIDAARQRVEAATGEGPDPAKHPESVSRNKQVTRFGADVDPALAPAGRDLIIRRADGEVEVAGSSNQGAHDGVAYHRDWRVDYPSLRQR